MNYSNESHAAHSSSAPEERITSETLHNFIAYRPTLSLCAQSSITLFATLLLVYLQENHEIPWSLTLVPLLLYSVKECLKQLVLWRTSLQSENPNTRVQSLTNWVTLLTYQVLIIIKINLTQMKAIFINLAFIVGTIIKLIFIAGMCDETFTAYYIVHLSLHLAAPNNRSSSHSSQLRHLHESRLHTHSPMGLHLPVSYVIPLGHFGFCCFAR